MAYHITGLEINGVTLTVTVEAPGAEVVKVIFETKQKPFTVHSLVKSMICLRHNLYDCKKCASQDGTFWETK